MKVSEIGEFGLIDLLAGMVEKSRDAQSASWQNLVLGIGDDAAAWRADNLLQLATVDALVQDVHFTLETTTFEELGWKALAVNLSDIAAMGGMPRYALVSLTLPGHTEVGDVVWLYRGMLQLAQRFGVAVIGGNMSSSPALTIHVTVLGASEGESKLLTRSAAKPGEQVAVTGYLGAAAAGLEMLSKRMILDKEATSSLGRALVKPEPRVAEGQALVKHGVRTGIDVSDGLLSDLRHICKASKVGARIEIARIPVHPDAKANFGNRALEMALAGGEDYELLFTGSAATIEAVKAAITCPVTVIGRVTAEDAGEITLVDAKGRPVKPPGDGWNHFFKG